LIFARRQQQDKEGVDFFEVIKIDSSRFSHFYSLALFSFDLVSRILYHFRLLRLTSDRWSLHPAFAACIQETSPPVIRRSSHTHKRVAAIPLRPIKPP
jgi:hypothetical protein